MRPPGSHPRPARRTDVRRWPEFRRTGTNPVEVTQRSAASADAGAGGCGRPQDRARDRTRTPPEGVMRTDRGGRCTRESRPGSAGPPPSDGERRSVPGCARSSREATTALVTPRLQHGAPGPGAHPLPEAVLAGTTPVVRLERALHAILLAGHRRRCTATSSGAAPARRIAGRGTANTVRLGHSQGHGNQRRRSRLTPPPMLRCRSDGLSPPR